MGAIMDTPTNVLVEQTAQRLEADGLIEPPTWSRFVKTGAQKDRPPTHQNWWQLRAASIMRKLYKEGPLGVSSLRSAYGGAKNNGHQPEHHQLGGGKIIRTILQQLEEQGFVTQDQRGGRVLTQEGITYLATTAEQMA